MGTPGKVRLSGRPGGGLAMGILELMHIAHLYVINTPTGAEWPQIAVAATIAYVAPLAFTTAIGGFVYDFLQRRAA